MAQFSFSSEVHTPPRGVSEVVRGEQNTPVHDVARHWGNPVDEKFVSYLMTKMYHQYDFANDMSARKAAIEYIESRHKRRRLLINNLEISSE